MESCETGVYTITNIKNGKKYVGSAARDFSERWKEHKRLLRRNRHYNPYLQNSWNKYGSECFVFDVVERCLPEDCIKTEQKYIDSLNTAKFEFGYNRSPTAGNCLGVKFSEETRAKMSARMTGKKMPEGTGEKISVALKGRKKTKEHCENIGRASKGRVHSAETRAKISKRLRDAVAEGRQLGPPAGWKHSAQSKLKMSASLKGRKFTPEHRANLSVSLKAARARKKVESDGS